VGHPPGHSQHRRMSPINDLMTNTFRSPRNILILTLVVGVPILLVVRAVHDLLSPRQWAFGMIAWVAMLLLLASTRKWAAKKKRELEEQRPLADDEAHKRMLVDIRKWKVWIGVLIVLLPIGTADGIAHRAWLPTLAGVGISLTLIYVAIREIKQRRKLLATPLDNN
jgi:divalent metal cation (Fe/Co/Zn/Cd) transporter